MGDIQGTLNLSYSDTMRKKEVDYTDFKDTVDAMQSSLFCLWLLDNDNCYPAELRAWTCPKQKYPNVCK